MGFFSVHCSSSAKREIKKKKQKKKPEESCSSKTHKKVAFSLPFRSCSLICYFQKKNKVNLFIFAPFSLSMCSCCPSHKRLVSYDCCKKALTQNSPGSDASREMSIYF